MTDNPVIIKDFSREVAQFTDERLNMLFRALYNPNTGERHNAADALYAHMIEAKRHPDNVQLLVGEDLNHQIWEHYKRFETEYNDTFRKYRELRNVIKEIKDTFRKAGIRIFADKSREPDLD